MGRKTVRDPGDRGLCSFVLFFPCCFPVFIWKAKVPPAHFAVALCFWVAFASLITAMTYRYSFHGSQTWRVFPGEARVLDYPRFTDTLFCSGARLEGARGARLFAYTAAAPPKLAPKSRTRFRLMRQFRLPSDRLMTFSAFLSPQSVLGAGLCSEDEAVMYIVHGDANLECVEESFEKTGRVDRSCVLSATEFAAGDNFTSCFDHPWPGMWAKAETAALPGQFHVVFEAVGDEAAIKAVMILNRSDYEDPRGTVLHFCNGSTSCLLPFHSSAWSGDRRVVVFRVGEVNHSQMEVEASCVPNFVAYLLLFFGGPAVLFAAVGLVTWRLQRREAQIRAARTQEAAGNFLRNADSVERINVARLSVSSELQPINRI